MSVRDIIQSAASSSAGNSVPTSSFYGNPFFSTYLYTGNGSTQTITNGIDLAGNGGMVWTKSRTNIEWHHLIDTARGTSNPLNSNDAGVGFSSPNYMTSFNSNGYTLGSSTGMNGSSQNFVSWTFRKAAKFFDVVTYTGNGSSNRQIAHELGIEPGMIIVKRLSGPSQWYTYHRALGGTAPNALWLNDTGSNAYINGDYWNSIAPTASVFTVGGVQFANVNNSGATYVAYLFAHDTAADGTIQCGTYTGNGSSANPPNIELGWEPQFILLKEASGVRDWAIVDNMRGLGAPSSVETAVLKPNLADAEAAFTNGVTITATGFQPRVAGIANLNGSTNIYMAIRRPTNLPTSGTQVFSCSYGLDTTPSVKAFNSPIAVDLLLAKAAAGPCYVQDRLRGAPQYMSTESTGGENASADWRMDTMNGVNHISARSDLTTRMGWMFKRAPGFFDIVCWTGLSGYQDVNHSLGVIPELLIYRSRTIASDWNVVAKASTGYGGTKLNLTLALSFSFTETASSLHLTDTTFNPTYMFGNTSSPAVAYLFATLAGVSKVGSYTGNGSSQTISCGFAAGARFILIKRIDAAGDWYIWDTVRGIVGGNDPHLSLNTTAAEATDDSIDPDNSGFIVNQLAATNINVTSAPYIFLAIA